MSLQEETVSETFIGRVKWFNSKSGFGFITVTEGDQAGNDIFVHHTSLNVKNDQYRYLLEGEYVELNISKVANEKYSVQATNVNGIKGGKLMCETNYEKKLSKNEYREKNVVPTQVSAPKDASTQTQSKSNEWVTPTKKRKNNISKK